MNNYQEDAKARGADFKGRKIFIAPLASIAVSAGNSSPKLDSGKQALLIDRDTLARIYNQALAEAGREETIHLFQAGLASLPRISAI